MGSYTPEQKAAVIADLLSGSSINQCVEKYDIPRGTIGCWSAQLTAEGKLRKTKPNTETNTKNERVGELIVENLEKSLETLNGILNTVNNESYITKQQADHVAVLFGVIADKTHRMLDSIARREQADRDEPEEEV